MAVVNIITSLQMSDYEMFKAFAEENDISDSAALRAVLKDFLDTPNPKRVLQYVVRGRRKK